MVLFSTYTGMLLWPVRQLGRILTDMGKALVAAERLQEVLDEPQEVLLESHKQPPSRAMWSLKMSASAMNRASRF